MAERCEGEPDGLKEVAVRYNSVSCRDTDNILDVGCGEGWGTMLLAQRCGHVVGIDVDGRSIDKARNRRTLGAEYITGDMADVDFGGGGRGQFDVVVCMETIEHTFRYADTVRAMYKALKPSGFLYLSTPNYNKSYNRNPYHMQEFTRSELHAILAPYSRIQWYGLLDRQANEIPLWRRAAHRMAYGRRWRSRYLERHYMVRPLKEDEEPCYFYVVCRK